MENNSQYGCVYLVGAGPGDRGLITVKGLSLLENADVIIYDNLANRVLLEAARPDAEKIYVGKKAGRHVLKQEQINDLLVQKAKAYKMVVRLKGGDPFVFGRGGEEALALSKSNILFEIVPGVTSGIGALAYAGIPVTHRNMATSLSLITGHEDPGKENSQLNWKAIASMHGTLVFYMGVSNLEKIVSQLLKYEKPAMTPAAVIQKGSTPAQNTILGKLGDIAQKARNKEVKPPALLVVGEVVSLSSGLRWFEDKPLFGKNILVTRARAQADDLVQKLESLGANIVMFPTIKLSKDINRAPLGDAVKNLGDYSWIIFTSVNSVESFFETLLQAGGDSRSLSHTKICAIGPSTTKKLSLFGLKTDIQPDEFTTEAIVSVFGDIDILGSKILLPRSDIGTPGLPLGLKKYGARVDEVTAYRICIDSANEQETIGRIRSGLFDLATFTSSSTVKNFVALVGHKNLKKAFSSARVACIGPVTKKTAESYGLKVHIQPEKYTISGLVQSICEHYTSGKKHD